MLPAAICPGRPRTIDMREVVNAIFYFLRGGCQRRLLPKYFSPHQTVYDYFRSWRLLGGSGERIHNRQRGDVRVALCVMKAENLIESHAFSRKARRDCESQPDMSRR
jgi:transposase